METSKKLNVLREPIKEGEIGFVTGTEGNFEFTEEKIPGDPVIKKNRMEIVLDALRMLDDGVIEKVGPTTADEL